MSTAASQRVYTTSCDCLVLDCEDCQKPIYIPELRDIECNKHGTAKRGVDKLCCGCFICHEESCTCSCERPNADDEENDDSDDIKCLDCAEYKCSHCSKTVFCCELFDSPNKRDVKQHKELRRGHYNECCKTATCHADFFDTSKQRPCPCTCRKAELKEDGAAVPACNCLVGACADCKKSVYSPMDSCDKHGTAVLGTYTVCCSVFRCVSPDESDEACLCACDLKVIDDVDKEEEEAKKKAPKPVTAPSKAKAEKSSPKKKAATKAKAPVPTFPPTAAGKVQAADACAKLPKWERVAEYAKKAAESRARVAEMMRASALETKARIERERAAKKSKTAADTTAKVAVTTPAAATAAPAAVAATEKKRPLDASASGKDAPPQKRARVEEPATTKKDDDSELTDDEVAEQKASSVDLKHEAATKSAPVKSAEQLKREEQIKKAIRTDKCLAARERAIQDHAEFIPCSECDDDTRMCAKCKRAIHRAVPCILCRKVFCSDSKDCRCSCDTTRFYKHEDADATQSDDDDDEVTILSTSVKCSS